MLNRRKGGYRLSEVGSKATFGSVDDVSSSTQMLSTDMHPVSPAHVYCQSQISDERLSRFFFPEGSMKQVNLVPIANIPLIVLYIRHRVLEVCAP